MEKSIEARLEEIFKEWYDEIRKNEGDDKKFTKDGIMFNENIPVNEIEDIWKKSSRRVLFLLKDQNQNDEKKWSEDIRYWLRVTELDRDKEHNKKSEQTIIRKEKNKNLQYPFIRKLAYLLWGLSKIDKNNNWYDDEVNKHFDEVKQFFNTQPFALVECKKLPGGGKVKNSEVKRHIKKYGEYLKNEIKVIDPNIIVCMSGNDGHHFLINQLCVNGELETCSKNVHIYRENGKETLIIFSYHPSCSRYNYGDFMYNCRDIIKNNFSAEAIK